MKPCVTFVDETRRRGQQFPVAGERLRPRAGDAPAGGRDGRGSRPWREGPVTCCPCRRHAILCLLYWRLLYLPVLAVRNTGGALCLLYLCLVPARQRYDACVATPSLAGGRCLWVLPRCTASGWSHKGDTAVNTVGLVRTSSFPATTRTSQHLSLHCLLNRRGLMPSTYKSSPYTHNYSNSSHSNTPQLCQSLISDRQSPATPPCAARANAVPQHVPQRSRRFGTACPLCFCPE
jgi:hypothetical protein